MHPKTKTLRPDAAALLDMYDVPVPTHWHRLEANQALPTHSIEQVLKGDVVRYVAEERRRQLSQASHDHVLPDFDLSDTSLDVHASLCKNIKIPQQYAYQLDVHDSIFHRVKKADITDDGENEIMWGRSGIVVSPCGSGKTHIGKHAAFAVRRPVIIVAPSNEAVQQWEAVFRDAHVPVRVLGRDALRRVPVVAERPPAVSITTYKLLAKYHDAPISVPAAHRSQSTHYEMMVALHVWRYGLMILDEVWTVPAKTHQRSCAAICTKMRLGLTADERRSDGNEIMMQSFVGPVLFEMTPQQARTLGVIALTSHRVVEVGTSALFREAYKAADTESRRLLAVLNPRKVHHLLHVLSNSAAKKVVVYCDKVEALRFMEDVLRREVRPYAGMLAGGVAKEQRLRVCEAMRRLPTCVALFSRAGNTAIDVPGIDLIFEVAVVDRSAQQKTQRDGRAQRVCAGKNAAEVVTLVTTGTHEVGLAHTRIEQSRSALPTEWTVAEDVDGREACNCPWTDDQIVETVASLASAAGRADAPSKKRMGASHDDNDDSETVARFKRRAP